VTISLKYCSKTKTSLFPQFSYQGTKPRPSNKNWLSHNPTKMNSFCNQTFHTKFLMHLWQFPSKIAQKPRLDFFTNFATKSQKAKPPNLAKPKPNQDQFLLRRNFSHLILDACVTISHTECSKITTSLFHHFCYHVTKSRASHQTWLSPNPTKINFFCNQTFHTSFCMHLWQFPTKIARNPRLHFFTNFATNA